MAQATAQTAPRKAIRPAGGNRSWPLLLIGSALAAIAVIVALGVALRGEQGGNESAGGGAREVSIEEIRSLATSKGHALYWAGPLPARKLELTENQRGEVFVRYLPASASIGTRSPVFTVIGTYPVAHRAFDAATRAAGRRGMISRAFARVRQSHLALRQA